MLQPSRLIKHMIVVSTWFSLPSYVFFLGYNRGNLQYGSPSFYLSKEISLQTHVLPVMAIFGWAARSWVAAVRPPGNRKSSATQHISRPKRHAKSMLFEKLREMGHLQSPGGIIFAVKDILSKYELNEGQNN